jgi:DNA polymerase III subunit beta
MKVEIEHAAFHEVIGRAAKALAARPATPILAGLLLRAEEPGTFRACAFDYELAVRASASATVGEPGSVLVSGRLLAEIARVLPKLPVTLTTDGAKVALICGGYRYTLACMPVDEYPSLPASPPMIGRVPAAAFVSAASQAALAAERDDTLPFLTGTRIEYGPEHLRLVAMDRYRLAVRDLGWSPASAEQDGVAHVPARTLLDAVRLFEADDEVGIGFEEGPGGLFGLMSQRLEVTLRQLDGAFIRYEKLFPEVYAGGAVIEIASLVEAIKAISLVAERNTPVRLAFAPGRVTIGAGSGDQAAAGAVTIDAEYDAEPVSIAAKPSYLLDGLSSLETPYVLLRYPEKARPVVLSGLAEPGADADGSFRYLFIPVRSVA